MKKSFLFIFFLLLSFSINALITINDIHTIDTDTVYYDDVYITATGVLQNQGTHTLTIYGSITNYGTIRNNPAGHYLTLKVSGNIDNEGLWENYRLNFIGTTDQHLIIDNLKKISCSYVGADSINTIIADSDLHFKNASIDFNDLITLDISNHTLYFDNTSLYDASIQSNANSFFNFSNDSFLRNVTFMNSIGLDGEINIRGNDVFFQGNTINYGTFQNYGGNSQCHFEDNFINIGTVKNNSSGYSLTLYLDKDIQNDGTWINRYTYLNGISDQHISGSGAFASTYFYKNNPSYIIANSNITFETTAINFQNNATFDFSGGYSLNLDDVIFRNCIISADSSSAATQINIITPSYLSNINFENDIELYGECFINDSNVIFESNLTLFGTLQNNSNSNKTMEIQGNLINNGIITDNQNGYQLYLQIGGNIINNGVFDNKQLTLTGTGVQHISAQTGKYFGLDYFFGNQNRATVYFDSDIEFRNTQINLMDDQIQLTQSCKISLINSTLYNGTSAGSDLNFDFIDNSYLSDFIFDNNIELEGVCNIKSNVQFNANLTVLDTLQNAAVSNYTTHIYGNLSNYGLITNNTNYYLILYVSGNLSNYGVIDIHQLNLDSSANQHLFCSDGSLFILNYFYGSSSANTIYLDSNLYLYNANFNLNGDTLFLTGDYKIYLSSVYLSNGILNGGDLQLETHTNSSIGSIDINNDTELYGIVQIRSNVNYNGSLTVQDTLQNMANTSYTFYCSSDVINNGVIRNNPGGYLLSMGCERDIINNGIWKINWLELTGSGVQHVSCANDKKFELTKFYANNTPTTLHFDSDIKFESTDVELRNNEIILSAPISLDLDGGYLKNGTFSGEELDLNFENGAYMTNMTFQDSVKLHGTINFASNVIFENPVRNYDIIQNYASTNYTVQFLSDICNYGTIEDNPAQHQLYLEIQGDIKNYGNWDNYQTLLKGSNNQLLECFADITGKVVFQSDISSSSYEWKFQDSQINSSDFSGVNSSLLTWLVDLPGGWLGKFNCYTNSGISRDITVDRPPLGIPQDVRISIANGIVTISWNSVLNARGYKVYSDINPNGSFSTLEWSGSDTSWSESVTDVKKFYLVKAFY